MTIVLTTHYLDEADTMAERVVVVDHGQVIADDTADGLKRTLAGDRVVLTVAVDGTASRVASIVENLPGARDVVIDGDRLEARVADAGAAVPELVLAASGAGAPLLEALAVRPTLDDVFLALTGRSLRESGTSTTEEVAA